MVSDQYYLPFLISALPPKLNTSHAQKFEIEFIITIRYTMTLKITVQQEDFNTPLQQDDHGTRRSSIGEGCVEEGRWCCRRRGRASEAGCQERGILGQAGRRCAGRGTVGRGGGTIGWGDGATNGCQLFLASVGVVGQGGRPRWRCSEAAALCLGVAASLSSTIDGVSASDLRALFYRDCNGLTR
jgi:hypothetical protein